MNEYFIVAKITAALAVSTSIFAVIVRLFLVKHRPSACPATDISIETYKPQNIDTGNYDISRATEQSMRHNRPTFKKNKLEDDMISRSFKINTMVQFEDVPMEMGLHAAGLNNSYFVE